MHSFARKLGSVVALSFFAFAVGCTGFFVNPTLSSIAIGPTDQTITVNPRTTLQMSATGSYSDGSTKDLTGKVFWSSSDTSCATISPAGLVSPATGVSGICQTNIGASSGTVSASTAQVSVTQGTPTSINLTVSNSSPSPGTQITFTAKAIFPGSSSQQDITSSVTWSPSDPTNLPLVQGSGAVSIPLTATAETATVQASFDNVRSNVVTINIQ
ncbi:MAG TPA: Ig-like domain-containing protein [Terriglobales bacterium]|nr:Ig-like domain-containing protein [Terriglobales bacterium]